MRAKIEPGYTQCQIRSGGKVDVVWLPAASFVIRGRHLRLGKSPRVWTVEEVYSTRRDISGRFGKRGYFHELPSISE